MRYTPLFSRTAAAASICYAGSIGAEASIGRTDNHTEESSNISQRWCRNSRINRMGSSISAVSIGLIDGSAATYALFLHKKNFEFILI